MAHAAPGACRSRSRRFHLQLGFGLLAALPLRATETALTVRIDLPDALRRSAGDGALSPVRAALVEAATPAGNGAPLLLASATSDAGHASSLALARHWRDTALAAGCAIAAADGDPTPAPADDTLALRDALLRATLAALESQWRWAASAPLLLAGFSGGAKYAAWLAALLAARGRAPAGIYMSGADDAALPQALRQLQADARTALRAVPVFMQAGEDDRIAPPARQRALLAELRSAGFARTLLRIGAGGHTPDPGPLRDALAWFASER